MNRTKRKKPKTTHTRKRISKEDIIINNASKSILDNYILTREAKYVEHDLQPVHLKRYSVLTTQLMTENIRSIGSYSPSINKRLSSVRESTYTDIFGCGAESVIKHTRAPNSFDINIGKDKHGNPICVSATSSKARDVFMKNFKSNTILNPHKIIVPMQRHSNCWFNTMFMVFFVSDKGRKFMRFFRQLMIEGKLINGKIIKPNSLSYAFILFNAAIEACYNHGDFKDNYTLALNTNNIIMHIYNSITNRKGIKNIKEYGNPYAYYKDIITYLDNGDNSVKLTKYSTFMDVNNFFKDTSLSDYKPDIILITLIDYDDNENAHVTLFNDKQEIVEYNNALYELDSVICRDLTKSHFCCALTCNKDRYIFDGAVFSKLQKKTWNKWINKDIDWSLDGSTQTWNFMKGYSMFFYYRKN